MSEQQLAIWTVYDRPKDYPQSIVARKFVVNGQGITVTNEIMVFKKLKLLREKLVKMELAMLPRSPDDDPNIIESWI